MSEKIVTLHPDIVIYSGTTAPRVGVALAKLLI